MQIRRITSLNGGRHEPPLQLNLSWGIVSFRKKPQTWEGKQSLKVIVRKHGPDDVITVVTGINAIAEPLHPPLHTDFTAHFRLIQDYELYNKVRVTAATTR